MKSIFLILFFHMLTFSCLTAQNNSRLVFYDQNHKLIKERFGVADNDTTVRNGFYEQYNLNGCLVSKGFYQNNNKTGQWITRNDDARVISAGIIQNENITGYNLRYNGSGNISRLEFINNGHLQKAKQDLHKKLIDSLMTAIISLSGSSDTLFSKKTAYFNERVGNYKLLADDSLKYYIGLRLIGDMINFSSDVEDYLSYKKEILRISGKIQNNYKGKLYSAYQKRLSEVDSDLKIFYRSDSLQLRNKAGVAAIISFNRSEKNIDRLLAIDNELNNKLAVFGNNYKTNYPAIYSRQVTNLNKQADLYHSTDSLELKISIGNKLVTRLDSLDSWYSQFDMIDSYLLGSLPGVRNKINQNFPVLIKCYLDPFEKDITAYKTIDSAELKLAKGASVLKNLEFLGSSLEKMTSNEMLINTKYPSLRDNYLKDYPGIFKNDIKPIEAEISRNKADTLIARRLEEGAKIIAKMNALDSIYIEIQQIDKKLDESLPAVKSHYHDHFPGIYNKEILSFETKKNEYENIGTAVSRLATGKDLLDKLKSYGSDYIILRTQK
ncbi:MAG: hypothetical protein NTW49_10515 [Bacteroidia bacterium]|nr:hypothetical protein [Bacteroidia bacterium]